MKNSDYTRIHTEYIQNNIHIAQDEIFFLFNAILNNNIDLNLFDDEAQV